MGATEQDQILERERVAALVDWYDMVHPAEVGSMFRLRADIGCRLESPDDLPNLLPAGLGEVSLIWFLKSPARRPRPQAPWVRRPLVELDRFRCDWGGREG